MAQLPADLVDWPLPGLTASKAVRNVSSAWLRLISTNLSFLFYDRKLPPETHQSPTLSFRLHNMHRGSPLLFLMRCPSSPHFLHHLAIGGNIIHSYRLLLLTLSRILITTTWVILAMENQFWCKLSLNCILIQVSNQLDDVGWFCRTHIVGLKGYACQSPSNLWTWFPYVKNKIWWRNNCRHTICNIDPPLHKVAGCLTDTGFNFLGPHVHTIESVTHT